MMNNKKIKLIIVLTIIIQLLLPSYLLYHHYNLHTEARKNSPEFKLLLESLDIYEVNDTDEGEENLYFSVKDVYNYYSGDVAVAVGSDGFARLSVAENKSLNNYWFTHKYYSRKTYMDSSGYEYAEGVDRLDLIYRVNDMHIEDIENPEGFYITAKVYKGVFLPMAIYLDNVKVIEFIDEK